MSKCKECGSKQNYNFALNIGLCNPCIHTKLENLQTENDKLKKLLEQAAVWFETDSVKWQDAADHLRKWGNLKGDNQ